MNDNAMLTPPSLEPIPPEPRSSIPWIFLGDDGLRAGWSLVIFILLMVAFVASANFIGHRLHPPAPKPHNLPTDIPASPRVLIGELIPFLITLLAAWIMSKIEQRPNSVYGLGGKRKIPNFLAGLIWGVACLSLLVVILLKAGFLVFDGRLLFGNDILRYGGFWLVSFIAVGLMEEYLTRGYLQYTLTRGLVGIYEWAFESRHSAALGFWTSAAIVSILFGLGHTGNKGESPIGLLSAGMASVVFCLSLWRTGSLWWAIGFHTAWDWAQSFLYGVADSGIMVQHRLLATHPVGSPILSGGATGPEGSIFIVGVLVLACIVIIFTLPKGRYGVVQDHSV